MAQSNPGSGHTNLRLKNNLQLQNERFEYAARASTDVIRDWDFTTGEVYWAEGFESRYGYKIQPETAQIDFWFNNIHPNDQQRVKQEVYGVINDAANNQWDIMYAFKIASGDYIYLHDKAYIIRNTKKEALRIVGALHNNTEVKKYQNELLKLNKELEKKAKELVASNAELEKFAYIASHDLQEPLRMVSSFLELLKAKYGNMIDQTAEKYIDFAVDGATRMKVLIQDLLEYSRLGTSGFTMQQVNFEDVITRIEKIYSLDINKYKIKIVKNNLPTLPANYDQMLQLMQNIIGNAIKYRKKDQHLVIQISARLIDNYYEFTVTDNGIGFDMKFAEKIFIIFQRLHLKEDYSGTGIGLAICSKIINKHHGKIWVSSVPGQGSDFYFTLPVNTVK